MTAPELVNPRDLGAPKGYSHGVIAPAGARLLFVAGQIGWDRDQNLVGDDFVSQFDQALRNVIKVVEEAGGRPESVVRLNLYVADKHEYLAELEAVGAAYRRVMGRHFPAMTLVEVQALLEPGAKVELECTAAIT